MNKTSVKTYGVQIGYVKGKMRYFCMCNGKRTSLHYSRKEFAMNQAYAFCKARYKDFTRSDGIKVKFEFRQI